MQGLKETAGIFMDYKFFHKVGVRVSEGQRVV